jgi:hypothetical protein
MANEINYNLQLKATNGSIVHDYRTGTLYADQTGSVASGGVQTVTTTAAALAVGSVTTAGFAFFRNNGPTNYVEIGTGTGTNFVAFIKLKAGEAAVCRLGTNAPTGRANTASVGLHYIIMQD